MRTLLVNSLRSSVSSGLLILKYVVPLHVLADILLQYDLLRPVAGILAPLTALLDLPPEAAVALTGGVLLNIYAAIAIAAPLGLSPYQWTILGVFLGICHSMVVESAIMARLGIAWWYSILLRGTGACLAVIPVLHLPASWFESSGQPPEIVLPRHPDAWQMLLHSLGSGLVLSAKIILLISAIILVMDLLKATNWVQARLAGVNTAFSLIAGQLLGITYGAGILLREASRGILRRQDMFIIGTFLMLCHSIVEDVLLFVLFGASYWVILGIRLSAALLISLLLSRLFRVIPLDGVIRP